MIIINTMQGTVSTKTGLGGICGQLLGFVKVFLLADNVQLYYIFAVAAKSTNRIKMM